MAVTIHYTFESEAKAQVFVDRVALYLKAATLREGHKVAVVTPRAEIGECDRLAMASSGTFKAPGVWLT